MNKRVFLIFTIGLIFVLSSIAFAETEPVESEEYNVQTPHVIINQILGGKNEALISHSFIELYNPTDDDVDLSSYAVHYKSSTEDSKYGDKWYKLNLTGKIPSKHSYLIRCQEHADSADAIIKITDSNRDIDFTLSGGGNRTL